MVKRIGVILSGIYKIATGLALAKFMICLRVLPCLFFGFSAASAEPIRVATYHVELTRKGPGKLLGELREGSPQIAALEAAIAHIAPDILLLTGIEYDYQNENLTTFAKRLGVYPYQFTLAPNSGFPSGFDLNGNGRLGERADALGYGRFPGHRGMAVLAKFPINTEIQNFSSMLWKDLPDARLPKTGEALFPSARVYEKLPFSSVGHWVVTITPPEHAPLSLLAFNAAAPIADGPAAFNALRNRAELVFWEQFLNGAFGPVPDNVILLGNANADPDFGEGARDVIKALITHPRLQDPHGPIPTAFWGAPSELPPMRVDYVLPDAKLRVLNQGVFAPEQGPYAKYVEQASRHRMVWVDLM